MDKKEEVIDGKTGEITTIDTAALEHISRGEIAALVATAKKYPRSLTNCRREALDLATLDENVAAECSYALKRKERDGGVKLIEGPSVRFAEILAYAWGNSRSGARVVNEGDKFVTAQGFYADLERNVAYTFEVQRRITNRDGKRYNDDMIGVTSMAACSIAMRNAVLHGIPKAVWKPIWERARAAAKGDLATLEKRRAEAFKVLKDMGVDLPRVCAALDVDGPQDVGLDELLFLSGMIQSVRDGSPIDEVFPSVVAGPAKPAEEPQKTARDRAREATKP